MSFDVIINKTVAKKTINYGIVFGNEKIVFIKSGANGSMNGYEDKYIKMANRLHERLGATVICSSNPCIEHGHVAADKSIILKTAMEMKLSEYEVYLLGTSDGAYHNLMLAKEIPQTVKFLGISTSRKGIEDLKEKLFGLSDIKKILVYGTNDYESDAIPYLKKFNCANTEIITIEGADHQFRGMLEEFIALSDLL